MRRPTEDQAVISPHQVHVRRQWPGVVDGRRGSRHLCRCQALHRLECRSGSATEPAQNCPSAPRRADGSCRRATRDRRLWIATSRAASGTRSTERAPRAPDAIPRQHIDNHFGRRHRRDLVDQCSAYACPMHAYAIPPRTATSTCRPPRNRSSPATSRRAHPAYACQRRVDKAPRKTPDKPVDNADAPTRICWPQRCSYAEGREEPEELVAGAGFEPATFGL